MAVSLALASWSSVAAWNIEGGFLERLMRPAALSLSSPSLLDLSSSPGELSFWIAEVVSGPGACSGHGVVSSWVPPSPQTYKFLWSACGFLVLIPSQAAHTLLRESSGTLSPRATEFH